MEHCDYYMMNNKIEDKIVNLRLTQLFRVQCTLKLKHNLACLFRLIHFTKQQFKGLLNESHPRVFQTITLSFSIAFKARQG